MNKNNIYNKWLIELCNEEYSGQLKELLRVIEDE